MQEIKSLMKEIESLRDKTGVTWQRAIGFSGLSFNTVKSIRDRDSVNPEYRTVLGLHRMRDKLAAMAKALEK